MVDKRKSRPYPVMFLMALLLHFASAVGGKPPLAPAYRPLAFNPPMPGSYRLPAFGEAADGEVIDSEGRRTRLHQLMQYEGAEGRAVVLSFIYSTCSDVNGCPLATGVLHKIKHRLDKDATLAGQIRLLTVSFNPAHDTPERMKAYGASLQGKGIDWQFLTPVSEAESQTILQAYGQHVEKVFDSKGKFTNTFNHALRVYLIDSKKQIRNIYNTELLHPDTLTSDIKTLLQADLSGKTPAKTPQNMVDSNRPGDDKANYGTAAYQTHSLALAQRQGQPANLLRNALQPPLGLPPVPLPANNPPTAEKIALGRKLFFDRRLSFNNTFSCAMCHVPEQGFTSNEMATAVGVEGRSVRRNSPTLYNVAYQKTLFHDGRESTLEQQVWSPLLAVNEMANPSIGAVVDKLAANPEYQPLFQAAFGQPPGMETIGKAIASYERTLNSANSPFDRWHYGKAEDALNAPAKQGFALFTGKAGCSQCHQIGEQFALLTDDAFHNTGIGYADAMNPSGNAKTRKVQLAPGVFAEVAANVIDSVAGGKANDLGRYEITQNPADRWRYKTPSLRNIALTAPYMHNGSLAGLREVVEFYNRGGIANENLDVLVKPLGLTASEIDQLVAFLEALTGDNTAAIVSDAFAAPVGDAQ